ncbi:MAG: chemotaxis protein CheX [Alicyclobacillus sp.]|nr:chemotaxis protein CheX [Alicyclobacillus sp.]
MSISAAIREILNGTLEAIHTVIPHPAVRETPYLVNAPIFQSDMGVLVGITGAVPGRLLVLADTQVFVSLASTMFGVTLEGNMLESFVGELGNMIGGNMCTQVSQHGLLLEVTPPTVLVGETKLSGFSKAICVPVHIETIGPLSVILALQDL